LGDNFLSSSGSSSLEDIHEELKAIRKKVTLLESHLDEYRRRLEDIATALKNILSAVNILDGKIEKTKQELTEQISALRGQVKSLNERVNEVEKNLDEHLAEQDEVLQKNSEALLNNLAMQFVTNVITKTAGTAHVILSHLNDKPFIVVEDYESIFMILISTEITHEDTEVLESIKTMLKEYTDKDVRYTILTTDVSKAESPAWLYALQ
jgi:prefoldin subunit 5